MAEYTPSTEEVRALAGVGWFALGDDELPAGSEDPGREFDRWLAKRDAEKWAEGQKSAIEDHGNTCQRTYTIRDNPYQDTKIGDPS